MAKRCLFVCYEVKPEQKPQHLDALLRELVGSDQCDCGFMFGVPGKSNGVRDMFWFEPMEEDHELAARLRDVPGVTSVEFLEEVKYDGRASLPGLA